MAKSALQVLARLLRPTPAHLAAPAAEFPPCRFYGGACGQYDEGMCASCKWLVPELLRAAARRYWGDD